MTTKSQARTPSVFNRFVHRIEEFIHLEASSGILLLVCTIVALIWVNSPWGTTYTDVWNTIFSVSIGEWGLAKPLILWINDGLMAIFFFVVGLEIKREILDGELSSMRKATLPIAAAIGGMVVPAGLYILFNLGSDTSGGWGIPMATDIAFALGILALLGKRVPLALKIFLTALAIVDDMGAVLVIAIFYTAKVNTTALFIAAAVFGVLIVLNRLGVRSISVYTIVGIILWIAVLKSGIHATIAGVLLALTIPARTSSKLDTFVDEQATLLQALDATPAEPDGYLSDQQQAAVQIIESQATKLQTPLQRIEHALHPWVAFAIMPIFALANAGVAFQGNPLDQLTTSAALGIIAGLLIGKPLGITLMAWLAVKLNIASLPHGVTWLQIHGTAWLAGVGFTMALFIAGLAFDATNLVIAKIAILVASLIAGSIGYIILRRTKTVEV